MVVSKSIRLIEQGQTACNSWRLTRGAQIPYALLILPRPILLYTFQANAGARRFYERHGFRAIQFTDGRANEEHCPDVLYEFAASPNPVIRVTGRS